MRAKSQLGGMFTNNFNTYLDYLSPDAYIPFNAATGTSGDPIAPSIQHDARLDPQHPTTPVFIGGKKRRVKKRKTTRRAIKGGSGGITADVVGATSVSNNTAYGALNSFQAPVYAAVYNGSTTTTSDVTNQPVGMIPASSRIV